MIETREIYVTSDPDIDRVVYPDGREELIRSERKRPPEFREQSWRLMEALLREGKIVL